MKVLLLALFLAWPAAAAAQSALAPGKLYVARGISESGPEPERSMAVQLLRVYQRLAGIHADDYVVLIRTSDDVNAFATVNGKGERLVIFTTRLLRGLKEDDAALAMVVGHEIGHHAAGHTTKGRDKRQAMGAITTIAGAIVDYSLSKRGIATGGLGRDVTNTAGQLVIMKFTRDQEREADTLGVRLLAQAGYDPQGAVRLQEKFLKAFGNNASLMSSHPPSKERVENVKRQIATDPVVLEAVREHKPG